jgi:hypothetical protein
MSRPPYTPRINHHNNYRWRIQAIRSIKSVCIHTAELHDTVRFLVLWDI